MIVITEKINWKPNLLQPWPWVRDQGKRVSRAWAKKSVRMKTHTPK
jgi:hypothetical protein